ncbi:MAG: universal stress protein [Gammaproteobacteria bacterium]
MKIPFVKTVFHPSDFTPASDNAFAHALAIALQRKTELTILNVSDRADSSSDWSKAPPVRATLERWGLLEEGSSRGDVYNKLKMRVRKIGLQGDDPVNAMLFQLENNPADLIVLATEGRDGLPRWLKSSVSERLARRARTMTLFVPAGGRGIVSLEDGQASLRRVLVPVDHKPGPQGAVEVAARVADFIGDARVDITLLHVDNDNSGERPRVMRPDCPRCDWSERTGQGDPVDEIIGVAGELEADLIVMSTAGHQGVLDALRGSVTEQVLRRAACPLLAVPV